MDQVIKVLDQPIDEASYNPKVSNALDVVSTFHLNDSNNAIYAKEIVKNMHNALFKPDKILKLSRDRFAYSQYKQCYALGFFMKNVASFVFTKSVTYVGIDFAYLALFITSLFFVPTFCQFLEYTGYIIDINIFEVIYKVTDAFMYVVYIYSIFFAVSEQKFRLDK